MKWNQENDRTLLLLLLHRYSVPKEYAGIAKCFPGLSAPSSHYTCLRSTDPLDSRREPNPESDSGENHEIESRAPSPLRQGRYSSSWHLGIGGRRRRCRRPRRRGVKRRPDSIQDACYSRFSVSIFLQYGSAKAYVKKGFFRLTLNCSKPPVSVC